AESDVVVLVPAQHGAGPDARALLDRDIADHLRRRIDPGVGMDPGLPARHLPDHRASTRPAAAATPSWRRIARLSGVSGLSSSVRIEKWSCPAMSMTSTVRPRRRQAAASDSV